MSDIHIKLCPDDQDCLNAEFIKSLDRAYGTQQKQIAELRAALEALRAAALNARNAARQGDTLALAEFRDFVEKEITEVLEEKDET